MHSSAINFITLQKKLPIIAFFLVAFIKKRLYRYPIVAFSKNATIGISIAKFRGLYSSI